MNHAYPSITEQICCGKFSRQATNLLRGALLLGTLHSVCLAPLVAAEKAKPKAEPAAETSKDQQADMAEKIRGVFPTITINSKERFVDIQSVVCLSEGYLELVVCAKDTWEHESIMMTEAKPSHIHAALLLIGARPGNPAMRTPVEVEGGTRWIDVPPKGQEVKVSLLLPDEKGVMKERPISDFVSLTTEESRIPQDAGAVKKFSDTFLFAGSSTEIEGNEKIYIGDYNGNVMSISTLGNEVLCLSGQNTDDDYALPWKITSGTIPEIGTKVILRLRPQKPSEKP